MTDMHTPVEGFRVGQNSGNHSITCHQLDPVDPGAARNLNRALLTHSVLHSHYQTLLSVQVM
ncbi:hypothetical protein D623_10029400 [Myotis brandtii]|uniref:Uncharacterized protein n=1 Tax=Myotis brandtii TaxID=109478 RepID=S7MJK9_MYOBR|nr:hypothetical protein D623_10029400 [Myotis brandtii]